MATDTARLLAYQLPELSSPRSAGNIPLTEAKLEKWLAELPVLNIKQLSFDLPNYLQQFNQIKISDKQRYRMLEKLRPIVAHLYMSLVKRFAGRNLDLSEESREIHWLIGELVSGMAMGYQRLLSEVSKKTIGIMNRSQYTVLAQRTVYYLGERIRLAYLLCSEPPKGAWQDLNATYAYACSQDLHTNKLKDHLAFFDAKGSIDALYRRILLLTMVSPYSLRGAEIDQVHIGLLPWVALIDIVSKKSSHESGYAVGFNDDYGPVYYPELRNIADKMVIDNSMLVTELNRWKNTGTLPEIVNYKGMSDKLLEQIIISLDAKKRRSEDRIIDNGEPVEIVMGLRDIDVFLEHIDSLIQNDDSNSPIPELLSTTKELGSEDDTDWDSLQFHTPVIEVTSARQISAPTRRKEGLNDDTPTVRRHRFTVENESKMGACISCSRLHGTGLYIGELMFIRGYDPEIWTLGVVRWMKVTGNKLTVGLYLVSAHVDAVIIHVDDSMADESINALWVAEGEHGDTLLLPRAEFCVGNQLQLTHNGQEIFATLGKDVWHSEGFAQFTFSVDKTVGNESEFGAEYLMPA